MGELDNNPDKWDALTKATVVLAVVGVISGLMGIYFSIFQARTTQEFYHLSVKPKIDIYFVPSTGDFRQMLFLKNDGFGPAIVKSLDIYDVKSHMKRYDQISEILTTLGITWIKTTTVPVTGITIPPGVIVLLAGLPSNDTDPKHLEAFTDAVMNNLAVQVGYESIYKDPDTATSWKSVKTPAGTVDMVSNMIVGGATLK